MVPKLHAFHIRQMRTDKGNITTAAQGNQQSSHSSKCTLNTAVQHAHTALQHLITCTHTCPCPYTHSFFRHWYIADILYPSYIYQCDILDCDYTCMLDMHKAYMQTMSFETENILQTIQGIFASDSFMYVQSIGMGNQDTGFG